MWKRRLVEWAILVGVVLVAADAYYTYQGYRASTAVVAYLNEIVGQDEKKQPVSRAGVLAAVVQQAMRPAPPQVPALTPPPVK